MKDSRAVKPLITALKSQVWHMRAEAADALGKLEDLQAVPHLITALADEHWVVRKYAAKALGRLGDVQQALPALITALGDEEGEVRVAVIKAIDELGDKQAIEPLILLSKNVDGGVKSIRPRLSTEIYHTIFEFIGKLGDIRAIGPLVAELAGRFPYWDEDKRKAIDILINLASESEEQCQIVAYHLWWHAVRPVRPNALQNDMYEPLLALANRLVVLEVERLPAPEYPDV